MRGSGVGGITERVEDRVVEVCGGTVIGAHATPRPITASASRKDANVEAAPRRVGLLKVI
jgi:hypothetical protein